MTQRAHEEEIRIEKKARAALKKEELCHDHRVYFQDEEISLLGVLS